jgi:hypothetical protein
MIDNIPDFTEIELYVVALLVVQADHEAQRAGRN